MADSRWHVDQFLAPTPVRVLVDVRGADLTEDRDTAVVRAERQDGDLRTLSRAAGLQCRAPETLVDAATERAEERSRTVVAAASAKAQATLADDLQRLIDLGRLNALVREEEIQLAREQLARVGAAIGQARLRLDSIRLLLEGPLPRD